MMTVRVPAMLTVTISPFNDCKSLPRHTHADPCRPARVLPRRSACVDTGRAPQSAINTRRNPGVPPERAGGGGTLMMPCLPTRRRPNSRHTHINPKSARTARPAERDLKTKHIATTTITWRPSATARNAGSAARHIPQKDRCNRKTYAQRREILTRKRLTY